MDRREFLKDAARTLLVLPFGTFLLHCEEDTDRTTSSNANIGNPTPPAEPARIEGSNAFFTSSLTEEHAHTFVIPLAAFDEAPIAGITGRTSADGEHAHLLEVKQEALRRVASGQMVRIETTKVADHTHTFTVTKLR